MAIDYMPIIFCLLTTLRTVYWNRWIDCSAMINSEKGWETKGNLTNMDLDRYNHCNQSWWLFILGPVAIFNDSRPSYRALSKVLCQYSIYMAWITELSVKGKTSTLNPWEYIDLVHCFTIVSLLFNLHTHVIEMYEVKLTSVRILSD